MKYDRKTSRAPCKIGKLMPFFIPFTLDSNLDAIQHAEAPFIHEPRVSYEERLLQILPATGRAHRTHEDQERTPAVTNFHTALG